MASEDITLLRHGGGAGLPAAVAQLGRLLLDLDQPLLDLLVAVLAAVGFAEDVERYLRLLLVLGIPLS